METKPVVLALMKEFGLELASGQEEKAKAMLVDHLNYLAEHHFQQLITILYRMDVSEQKLRALLRDNPHLDAGTIIADLVIERQLQKIKSREAHRQRNDDIAEDEKW